MRRLLLAATILLGACRADALFGPVTPPCRRYDCLVVSTWNPAAQRWTDNSTCWCAQEGWP